MLTVSTGDQRIRFQRPVYKEIRGMGYTAVDMHLHSHHSDAANSIPSIISRAKHLGIGIAITDHNEIQGVVEAYASAKAPEILIIPGIELSAQEGPHILMYFYSPGDLRDFFDRHIKGKKGKSEYMAVQLTVENILDAADNYSCVTVAAHPYGYFGINRGVLKCINNKVLPADIIDRFDGIEVICGGMSPDLNGQAERYARVHDLAVTGGSDSHVLPSIGSVVTCVKADTVECFLAGVLAKESIVIGSTVNLLHKGMTAGIIAWKYIPSTVSSLQVHYDQNLPRIKRYIKEILR